MCRDAFENLVRLLVRTARALADAAEKASTQRVTYVLGFRGVGFIVFRDFSRICIQRLTCLLSLPFGLLPANFDTTRFAGVRCIEHQNGSASSPCHHGNLPARPGIVISRVFTV